MWALTKRSIKTTHLSTTLPAAAYSDMIKTVRKKLKRTQKELAVALGVSTKAIQSYEQGWRDVPSRVMIQLFILLAIYEQRGGDGVPCWEITDCPDEERNNCPSYTIGRGQLCWFVAARSCRVSRNSDASEWPCGTCPVIAGLLGKPPRKERPPRT